MKDNELLLAVAVLAVVVSIVATGFTYYSLTNLAARISGFATGEANLTVETLAQINFTNSSINWGSGIVNSGQTAAYLDSTVGTVVNGNWTAVTGGLVIDNIGNTNVTLNLTAGADAAGFIGGTGPSYKWNVSNVEANSCLNATGGTGALNLNLFYNVNTTTTLFCNIFQHLNGANSVEITFNLTVPDDSKTGTLSNTITATAVGL